MSTPEFHDVRGANRESEGAMAVEPFMASLVALQAEVATAKNRVWTRVASAPDVDALNLGSSEHFAHWS